MESNGRSENIVTECIAVHRPGSVPYADMSAYLIVMLATRNGVKEWEEHMASGHVIYRNGCKHCVHGQAVSDPHRKSREEGDHPIISLDYTFFGETSKDRKGRTKRSQEKWG